MIRNRLLFVCKHRHNYWGGGDLSSGLFNSVRFIVDMLNDAGVEAKFVDVVDNNAIDQEVTTYKPTVVVVEAFWVVPEKFDVLRRLHPHVRWLIRNHSEMPFLSQEGIAFEWLAGYLERGIEIACNSRRATVDLRLWATATSTSPELVTYLPNYYPPSPESWWVRGDRDGMIDVGCFGAIRPLKNQVSQAIAAMALGHAVRTPVRFHINAQRVEGRAEPILRNLRAMFAASNGHRLVEHPWMTHENFKVLLKTMDVSMQVSFSETFNIVSADSVVCNVPIVVSSEVSWIGDYAVADPTRVTTMLARLEEAWREPRRQRVNRQKRELAAHVDRAEKVWLEHFG